jgi:hypothetical protein
VCVCVCVIRFDDVIRVLPPAPEVKRKQLMDLDDTKAQQVRSGGPVSPGAGRPPGFWTPCSRGKWPHLPAQLPA